MLWGSSSVVRAVDYGRLVLEARSVEFERVRSWGSDAFSECSPLEYYSNNPLVLKCYPP